MASSELSEPDSVYLSEPGSPFCPDEPSLDEGVPDWRNDASEAIIMGWEGDSAQFPTVYLTYNNQDTCRLLYQELLSSRRRRRPRSVCWRPLDLLNDPRSAVRIGSGTLAQAMRQFESEYHALHGNAQARQLLAPRGTGFLLKDRPSAQYAIFGVLAAWRSGIPVVHLIPSREQGRDVVRRLPLRGVASDQRLRLFHSFDGIDLPESSDLPVVRIESAFLSGWLQEFYYATYRSASKTPSP